LTAVHQSPPTPGDIGPALLGAARGGTPGPEARGGLTARLERWAADARVDEAARSRSRERWLRRQAEEERTLAGVLADMLEARVPVSVHTVAPGAAYAGVVRALGADFVALGAASARAGEVVVALAAVASVRPRAATPEVIGDRRATGTLRLAEVLSALAEGRDEVRITTRDGGTLAGVVGSVGQDVIGVRSADPGQASAFVPIDAIVSVAVGG
jgi:hypothetical protein